MSVFKKIEWLHEQMHRTYQAQGANHIDMADIAENTEQAIIQALDAAGEHGFVADQVCYELYEKLLDCLVTHTPEDWDFPPTPEPPSSRDLAAQAIREHMDDDDEERVAPVFTAAYISDNEVSELTGLPLKSLTQDVINALARLVNNDETLYEDFKRSLWDNLHEAFERAGVPYPDDTYTVLVDENGTQEYLDET